MKIKGIKIPDLGVDMQAFSDGVNVIIHEDADYIAALAAAFTAVGWFCLPHRNVIPVTVERKKNGAIRLNE